MNTGIEDGPSDCEQHLKRARDLLWRARPLLQEAVDAAYEYGAQKYDVSREQAALDDINDFMKEVQP